MLAITLHSHVKFMFEWLKVAVLSALPKYYFCIESNITRFSKTDIKVYFEYYVCIIHF